MSLTSFTKALKAKDRSEERKMKKLFDNLTYVEKKPSRPASGSTNTTGRPAARRDSTYSIMFAPPLVDGTNASSKDNATAADDLSVSDEILPAKLQEFYLVHDPEKANNLDKIVSARKRNGV